MAVQLCARSWLGIVHQEERHLAAMVHAFKAQGTCRAALDRTSSDQGCHLKIVIHVKQKNPVPISDTGFAFFLNFP
jgi:hypothetical protein